MRHWVHFIAAMISVIPFTGVIVQNDGVCDGVTEFLLSHKQGFKK